MATPTNVYDIWSAKTRANPQAVYERMRSEAPVYRAVGPHSGNNFWFITRYDDCMAVLKNDQTIGKEFRNHLPPEVANKWGPPPDSNDVFEVINHHLLNIDPPDHTRLRSLVHKAFTPKRIENLRPRIQEITDDLIDQMQGKSQVDLIAAFSFPLPITVIAEMLGVPAADRDRFRDWTRTLLFVPDADENRRAVMEFGLYMNNLIDERRENPQDDVLTGLIEAEEAGERLDRMELLSMLFLLLVAGHETTVNLVANGTLLLLQYPDQMEKLKNDPSLIRTAIEEILRYNGPVETTTFRWAFEDVEIGGVTIPAGDVVLPALLAANRDPAYFKDPNVFDITRENNKHIAFGLGIHYCVGAPLARMEGAIAINTLLKRLPNIQLAVNVDDLQWNESILLHGMKEMPVTF
jgi:cytochrome P450 PksS